VSLWEIHVAIARSDPGLAAAVERRSIDYVRMVVSTASSRELCRYERVEEGVREEAVFWGRRDGSYGEEWRCMDRSGKKRGEMEHAVQVMRPVRAEGRMTNVMAVEGEAGGWISARPWRAMKKCVDDVGWGVKWSVESSEASSDREECGAISGFEREGEAKPSLDVFGLAGGEAGMGVMPWVLPPLGVEDEEEAVFL
jgi:hypothetical protein